MSDTEVLHRPRLYFWLGLITGGILGAGMALLATPVTGEEARDLVAEKAFQPARMKLYDWAGRLRVKVKGVGGKTKPEKAIAVDASKARANGGFHEPLKKR